jgi:phage shock protein A
MADETQEPREQPVLEGEIVSDPEPVALPETDYDQAGVPSFDYVRDRIENRVNTSIGAQELANATPEGQSVEDQFAAREKAGRDKLEEIRRAMRGE